MAEIKNRGHEVIFCTAKDEYTSKLQKLGFKYIPIVLDRKGVNVFKDLLLMFTLIKIYKKERPDWVFHNSTKPFLYGTIAAYFTGCRCINTHSGLGYLFIKKRFLTNFLLIFYKFAGLNAVKTFFQNKDDMQYFLDKKLIAREKCMLVGGSGVNTEYFKPSSYIHRQSSENSFIFLYLGRMLWDKGIGELIWAVRTLKRQYPLLSVNFLGMIDTGNPAGISKSQIQEWVDEGLIKYLGEKTDVRLDLENCDCVILPSYREGTPRSLLEAAAMGLPIIATDVPGCRAVVEQGVNGLLVKVNDPFDLTHTMEVMMNTPESQRREMGKRGRDKVNREFNEQSVIRAYCSCIGV